ncbi:MAG: methionyl-tRNA formyltransferase [Candidatus Binatia bacterium]
MRIALIGQAAFAQRVLDGVRARGHEVAAVYCPPDTGGGKPDPVKVRALDLGIPVHQHRALKGADVAATFAGHGADLGLLAYVTQIVPPAVFDAPRLGSICFHPSLLPRYRGGSAIPWQIIKGETRTGVSVFWVDPGIDTGPLLLQKDAPIGADDTGASLYYNTLFELGIDTVLEAVDLIDAGRAPRLVQDEAQASYDPLCRDEHAAVDWRRPVGEVYNLIRGCDPQPGAYVDRGSARVRFYDARRVDSAAAAPGTITVLDDAGLTVAASGGAIRIGRLRVGDQKLAAREAAASLGLSVGQPIAG